MKPRANGGGEDELFKIARRMRVDRNRLVHPKTKELNLGNDDHIQACAQEDPEVSDVEIDIKGMERTHEIFIEFDPDLKIWIDGPDESLELE